MIRLTIGVAIAVPEPHGSLLREMRAAFGDPLAQTVPSHVTLLPPLDIAADDLDEVCAQLDKTAGAIPSFPMRLRGTGSFRPVSPVVFVTVHVGFMATEVLAGRLRWALSAPAAEFPYHPHVTVAHHLDDGALDHADRVLKNFDCTFDVEEFSLYLHDDAAGWVPQRSFALANRPS